MAVGDVRPEDRHGGPHHLADEDLGDAAARGDQQHHEVTTISGRDNVVATNAQGRRSSRGTAWIMFHSTLSTRDCGADGQQPDARAGGQPVLPHEQDPRRDDQGDEHRAQGGRHQDARAEGQPGIARDQVVFDVFIVGVARPAFVVVPIVRAAPEGAVDRPALHEELDRQGDERAAHAEQRDLAELPRRQVLDQEERLDEAERERRARYPSRMSRHGG